MKQLHALAVILTVASVSLAGQAPAEAPIAPPVEGPTFRTGIDLIAVDVSVVDDDGRPVEDLFAPEFTVKIDGEERRVGVGDAILIPPGARHRITASDDGPLRLLCACAPPWSAEDTHFA